MATLWWVLLAAALVYGAILFALYLTQAHLLYLPHVPTRKLTTDPSALGLPFESVELTTADGVRLHGWYVPQVPARGVLLFCHGNAGNIGHRLESVELFHQLGLSVLIFDYRGYGQSHGHPSEQGTYLDAEAAWDYLVEERHVEARDIVLFGRSLGGPIAAHVAAQQGNASALILESTFTAAPDLAAELYTWIPTRWLLRFRYNTQAYVRQVSTPVLIVHSRTDELVAYGHAEQLYASANEPKTLLTLRGGHNDAHLLDREHYAAGLDSFLSHHLGPASVEESEPQHWPSSR